MRKILFSAVMLMLILCFAGCGSEADNAELTAENEPFAISDLGTSEYTTAEHESFQQNLSGANFRCIDGGIYTIRTFDDIGSFLYFTYDAAYEFFPLCSKSGCSHNSADCDAYVFGCYTYGFYNDRIYYAVGGESGFEIWGMKLDGSDHRKVNEIILEAVTSGSAHAYTHNIIFDNGFVYFYVDYDNGELLLGRLSLEEGAQPEYYNTEGISGFYHDLAPADGILYASACAVDDDFHIFRCSSDTPPEIIIGEFESDIFSEMRFSKEKVCYYRDGTDGTNGFYEWSAATGRSELIKEFAVPTNCAAAFYDGDYIYIEEIIPHRDEFDNYTEKTHLFIFDSDYNLIRTSPIPFDKKRGCSSIITATDEQILFAVTPWAEKVEYYINKSDISSGMEWHEVG